MQHTSQLYTSSLENFVSEPTISDFGAIMLCRAGNATFNVDFDSWKIAEKGVITIFPGDLVSIESPSRDFLVEILRFTPKMLREASLQLENTVYSSLRHDRCRCDNTIVFEIIDSIMRLLAIYFRQSDCACIDEMTLHLLKAFFTGYHDWMTRIRDKSDIPAAPRRAKELFNAFMELLETHHRTYHDVAFYSGSLNITPKYLYNIVKQITGKSPKTIIDHYLVLQLKKTLRRTPLSVKQIAWEYHFNDTAFLCRYFKAHTGRTPQQFRSDIVEDIRQGDFQL